MVDIGVKVGKWVIVVNSLKDGSRMGRVGKMKEVMLGGNMDEREVGSVVRGMGMKIRIGGLEKVKLEGKVEYMCGKGVEKNGGKEFEVKGGMGCRKGGKMGCG